MMDQAVAQTIARFLFQTLGPRVKAIHVYPARGDATVRIVVHCRPLSPTEEPNPLPFIFTPEDLRAPTGEPTG